MESYFAAKLQHKITDWQPETGLSNDHRLRTTSVSLVLLCFRFALIGDGFHEFFDFLGITQVIMLQRFQMFV